MTFVGLASPLSQQGFATAAAQVNADPIALWAVVTVETSGKGFLPDRQPDILFERHIFSRRTGGRFDASHSEISGPAGGYGKPGSHQHTRLANAILCHRLAALESASWGMGQIMGFNSAVAGYGHVEDMVQAMMRSEDDQILGMAHFLKNTKTHVALQRRDWTAFARAYNGPTFAKNRYDERLASAFARFSASGLPDFDVRAVQLLLTYHGFDPGPVDGVSGGKTKSAIAAFRARHESAVDATTDRDLGQILKDTLPRASGREDARDRAGTAGSAEVPVNPRMAQSLLRFLGLEPGPIDGKPGPMTRRATVAFQKSISADPTGEIDHAMLTGMRAEAIRRCGRDGMADTLLVQQLLTDRGISVGKVDGLFGPRTRQAIAAFERSRGSEPQGSNRIEAALLESLLR